MSFPDKSLSLSLPSMDAGTSANHLNSNPAGSFGPYSQFSNAPDPFLVAASAGFLPGSSNGLPYLNAAYMYGGPPTLLPSPMKAGGHPGSFNAAGTAASSNMPPGFGIGAFQSGNMLSYGSIVNPLLPPNCSINASKAGELPGIGAVAGSRNATINNHSNCLTTGSVQNLSTASAAGTSNFDPTSAVYLPNETLSSTGYHHPFGHGHGSGHGHGHGHGSGHFHANSNNHSSSVSHMLSGGMDTSTFVSMFDEFANSFGAAGRNENVVGGFDLAKDTVLGDFHGGFNLLEEINNDSERLLLEEDPFLVQTDPQNLLHSALEFGPLASGSAAAVSSNELSLGIAQNSLRNDDRGLKQRNDKELHELDLELQRHISLIAEQHNDRASTSGGGSVLAEVEAKEPDAISAGLSISIPSRATANRPMSPVRFSPVRFSPLSDSGTPEEEIIKPEPQLHFKDKSTKLFLPGPNDEMDLPGPSWKSAEISSETAGTSSASTSKAVAPPSTYRANKSKRVPIYKQKQQPAPQPLEKSQPKIRSPTTTAAYEFIDEEESSGPKSASDPKETELEAEVQRKLLQISSLHPELKLSTQSSTSKISVAPGAAATAGGSSMSPADSAAAALKHILPKKRHSYSTAALEQTKESAEGAGDGIFKTPPVSWFIRSVVVKDNSTPAVSMLQQQKDEAAQRPKRLPSVLPCSAMCTVGPPVGTNSNSNLNCKPSVTIEKPKTALMSAVESSALKPTLILRIKKKCLPPSTIEELNGAGAAEPKRHKRHKKHKKKRRKESMDDESAANDDSGSAGFWPKSDSGELRSESGTAGLRHKSDSSGIRTRRNRSTKRLDSEFVEPASSGPDSGSSEENDETDPSWRPNPWTKTSKEFKHHRHHHHSSSRSSRENSQENNRSSFNKHRTKKARLLAGDNESSSYYTVSRVSHSPQRTPEPSVPLVDETFMRPPQAAPFTVKFRAIFISYI